jgi:DNA repair exonuclease SbcCD ATPase subunit
MVVSETTKTRLNGELQTIVISVDSNTKDISKKENLIKVLASEKEIEKVFKLYIEMVGKKGISKLVLRSVLPIINSELQRLLEDITDFDVEVFIDDKNEVRYLLIKDGIEKALKSGSGFELTTASIALRCVLGKMSSLPTPNFITFDEVMGRVAPENIPNMKPLFERISDMFDIVFFITQNEVVKDWSDNIITIEKVNNISKLNIK